MFSPLQSFGSVWVYQYKHSFYVWQNSPVKPFPSGLEFLFAVSFFFFSRFYNILHPVIELFKLSVSSWLNFGRLYVSRNFSISSVAAKSLQSCPTLCNPIDGSPPGSPVPGILQVRTLEWVAISFSNAGKWKVKVKSLSRVRLLETPWTAAYQAPPSMGFSRQKYWSGINIS